MKPHSDPKQTVLKRATARDLPFRPPTLAFQTAACGEDGLLPDLDGLPLAPQLHEPFQMI